MTRSQPLDNRSRSAREHAQGEMRERIVEVSSALFAERGYAGTSVRDIAGELDISSPGLYHHFASKADILGELMDRLAAALQRLLDAVEASPVVERPEAAFTGFLRLVVNNWQSFVLMLNDPSVLHSRGTDQRVLAQRRRLLDVLTCAVAGRPDDPQARLRVVMAVGGMQAVVLEAVLSEQENGGAATHEDLHTRRDEIVALALDTLRS